MSFIVPMFNVELYIEKCILSLCNQDLSHEEYEIIVIDDCSEDNSVDLVKNLQKEYPLIKLFYMPINSKQGTVRNKGVLEAKGKYIWFIDSDDYIEENILSKLLEYLEEDNLDILHFNYFEVFENADIKPYSSHYETTVISGIDFFFDENELWWKKCVEVWRRIHKKSFLTKHSFQFAVNVMYEDTDYSIEMFTVSSKVKHIDISPYYYRCNLDSTTNSIVSSKHLESWIQMSLRCDMLKKKIIRENRDIRFVDIIDNLVSYQLSCVLKSFRAFNKNLLNEFKITRDIDISPLKSYISFRNYLSLKYPKISFLIGLY